MSFTSIMMSQINSKLEVVKKFIISNSRSQEAASRQNSNYEELQESLDMALETNISLRMQLVDKQAEVEKIRQANVSLKEELETKEVQFEEDRRFFSEQIKSLQNEVNKKEEKVKTIEEKHESLKREYEKKIHFFKEELEKSTAFLKKNKYRLEQMISKSREDQNHSYKVIVKKILQKKDAEILTFKRDNNKLIEESQSTRTALEFKEREIKCLKLIAAEAKEKEEILNISLERIELLRARCENLQDQLRSRSEYIQLLEKDIEKLSKFITEENKSKGNLLHQNNARNSKRREEVVTEILANFICDLQDSQYFPKIKNLVRKGQSIGYMLDLDEKPTNILKIEASNHATEKLEKGKNGCQDWLDVAKE